jgi:hypothetical protein
MDLRAFREDGFGIKRNSANAVISCRATYPGPYQAPAPLHSTTIQASLPPRQIKTAPRSDARFSSSLRFAMWRMPQQHSDDVVAPLPEAAVPNCCENLPLPGVSGRRSSNPFWGGPLAWASQPENCAGRQQHRQVAGPTWQALVFGANVPTGGVSAFCDDLSGLLRPLLRLRVKGPLV